MALMVGYRPSRSIRGFLGEIVRLILSQVKRYSTRKLNALVLCGFPYRHVRAAFTFALLMNGTVHVNQRGHALPLAPHRFYRLF